MRTKAYDRRPRGRRNNGVSTSAPSTPRDATRNEAIARPQSPRTSSAPTSRSTATSTSKAQGRRRYVGGEETAILEKHRGKRGIVRLEAAAPAIEWPVRPPPVINNVISFASVPRSSPAPKRTTALRHGPLARPLPMQLRGNISWASGRELRITLRELNGRIRRRSASGRPSKALQVDGPLAPTCRIAVGPAAGLLSVGRRSRRRRPLRHRRARHPEQPPSSRSSRATR